MIFTPGEVETYYRHLFPKINTSGREWRMACPVHNGTDLNFVVDPQSGLAICHSQCGRGWDIIALEMEIHHKEFGSAKDDVFRIIGRPIVPFEEKNLEAVYDYVDETGKTLYQVLRYHGKEFKQRKPDGRGGYHYGLGDVRRVPYRLDKIINAPFVALAEGEKDVHTLEHLGIVASCSSGGAGNVFKPEAAEFFRGKDIAIFPDNDDPGRKYAIKTAEALNGIAKSIKIIELPDLDVKQDVTDWVFKGGNKQKLRELYARAQFWSPDWRWANNVPRENNRYNKRMIEAIEEAGGLTEFWNLARLEGLATPYTRLSRFLGGGLRRSEFYVIGGNQGSGKTSLALQFAIKAIRSGHHVVMFSMEMNWNSVFQRMVAIEARVNLNELMDAQITLKRKDVSSDDIREAQQVCQRLVPLLCQHTTQLAEHRLLVSNKSGVTPEHIIDEIKYISNVEPVSLVIVDHIQLMDCAESNRSDYEKFTKISRMMKQVAMELRIPILLISQTSRLQSHEKRTELEVSDLRGSGAFEEDAAAVLLLYEDFEDRKLALSEGDGSRYMLGPVKCHLKIGKSRYGGQGKVFRLLHHKAFTRFDEEPYERRQTKPQASGQLDIPNRNGQERGARLYQYPD